MKRRFRVLFWLFALAAFAGTLSHWPAREDGGSLSGSVPGSLPDLSPTEVMAQTATPGPSFAEVAAIFKKYHCTVCHGGASPSRGLSLDNREGVLKGGKKGPVVIPGEPGKSELLKRIRGVSEPRMPYDGPPWLTEAEGAVIEGWIASGAPANG
ncbi:MAG TPA: hypothetical protein PLM79_02010 [Syntrophobacteraceae bacterium]|nr:hypothetical protein [Syntrophobacteraceae bacterium]